MPEACPDSSTTYTLRVTDDDGNLYTSTVTVQIVNMTTRLYRPQVFGIVDNNQVGGTQINENDVFTKGVMTFVNLDNDDEDGLFDNLDNEVTGGDDELIKWEIENDNINVPEAGIIYFRGLKNGNDIKTM
jgi:hypothetical protein